MSASHAAITYTYHEDAWAWRLQPSAAQRRFDLFEPRFASIALKVARAPCRFRGRLRMAPPSLERTLWAARVASAGSTGTFLRDSSPCPSWPWPKRIASSMCTPRAFEPGVLSVCYPLPTVECRAAMAVSRHGLEGSALHRPSQSPSPFNLGRWRSQVQRAAPASTRRQTALPSVRSRASR